MSKVKSKKAERSVQLAGANPIRDVMESKQRGRIVLSEEDIEIIRNLELHPPEPTPELIRALQEHMKNRPRIRNNSSS